MAQSQPYIHPFTYGSESPLAVDFMTYAVRKRLPKYRVCPDPKPPFILDGQDNWNCAKCPGQPSFMLPVLTTDRLQFLFQYEDTVNEDPADPVFGWFDSGVGAGEYYMSARILDCDCNPVADMVYLDQFASDYGVAYDSEDGSFQWLTLDTGLLPSELCCFILQVEQYVFDVDAGFPVLDQIITAGPFYRADAAFCGPCGDATPEEETILISGQWKKRDCWGRRYDIPLGVGQTLFTDSIRLAGNIVYLGSENESVFDGDVEVKNTKRDRYRLELAGIPPIIAQWLGTILASSDVLTIGDYTIDRRNGDTVSGLVRKFDDVEMFHAVLDFSIVCEIRNFGCE